MIWSCVKEETVPLPMRPKRFLSRRSPLGSYWGAGPGTCGVRSEGLRRVGQGSPLSKKGSLIEIHLNLFLSLTRSAQDLENRNLARSITSILRCVNEMNRISSAFVPSLLR